MPRRAAPLALVLLLAAGFGARAWLSVVDDGIYWPDEIHASLEPAHRLIHGYGLISWEYGVGARSWALPALLAGVLWMADAAGLDDPREYLLLVRFLMSALALASAWAGYLLARRFGASEWAGVAGASVFAIAGPAVYFGPRALSDTISILPVVLGLAFALPASATRGERIAGASLLGVALLLRLHTGIFGLALCAAWAGRRQWRSAAEIAGVFLTWGLILGALDWVTWGEWFQSPRLYFDFTFGMDGGALTGDSAVTYYAEMFVRSMPFIALVLTPLALAGSFRAPALAFVVLVLLAAHLITPNKAYRYVLVALPLAGALGAVGLTWLAARRPRLSRIAGVALVCGCLVSLVTMPMLTFREIGPWERTRASDSALDDVGPVNRLLIEAGRQGDVCGVRIQTHHLAWTGGYTYLHRQVPLYAPDGPGPESGFYNYVIVLPEEAPGNPVAHDGNYVLRRIASGCRPDPNYSYYLPGFEDIRRRLGR
jgi:phosphatidylinositol glycan class B